MFLNKNRKNMEINLFIFLHPLNKLLEIRKSTQSKSYYIQPEPTSLKKNLLSEEGVLSDKYISVYFKWLRSKYPIDDSNTKK